MKWMSTLLTIIALEISGYMSTCWKTDDASKLIECLVDIIENLQGTVRRMSLVTSQEDNTYLEDFLSKMRVPIVVNTLEQRKTLGIDTRVPSDIVILYGDVNVSEVLKSVLRHRDTRFLIVNGTQSKMEKDFRVFWMEKVVKVFAVVEETEGVALYSYQPYQKGDCDSTKPILLDIYINGTFSGDGLCFVNEKIRISDMMGCSANVSVVDVQPMVLFSKNSTCGFEKDVDGIEARYLKVIERKLNFTGRYCIAKDGRGWGRVRPPSGVVGDVFKGISDFGFGLIAPVLERHENLELSRNYNGRECITFAVPVGVGYEPFSWLNSIKSDLRLIQWVLIVISLAGVTALFSLGTTVKPAAAFMYVFAILIGHTVKLPKRKILRNLMLFWILFCSAIGDIYQASLGSRIIVPVRLPEIKTFVELLESPLQLMGYPNMLDIVEIGRDNPHIAEIGNRFVLSNVDINTAVDIMAHKERIAYIRHMSTFTYAILVNPKAKGNIRPLAECVYNYYPVIAMQKHSPFAEKVDELIFQIFESGIGLLWKSHFLHEIKDIPPGYHSLTFNQSLGIFVVLFIGHSLAFIAFVTEVATVLTKRLTGRLRRNK